MRRPRYASGSNRDAYSSAHDGAVYLSRRNMGHAEGAPSHPVSSFPVNESQNSQVCRYSYASLGDMISLLSCARRDLSIVGVRISVQNPAGDSGLVGAAALRGFGSRSNSGYRALPVAGPTGLNPRRR